MKTFPSMVRAQEIFENIVKAAPFSKWAPLAQFYAGQAHGEAEAAGGGDRGIRGGDLAVSDGPGGGGRAVPDRVRVPGGIADGV